MLPSLCMAFSISIFQASVKRKFLAGADPMSGTTIILRSRVGANDKLYVAGDKISAKLLFRYDNVILYIPAFGQAKPLIINPTLGPFGESCSKNKLDFGINIPFDCIPLPEITTLMQLIFESVAWSVKVRNRNCFPATNV